MADALGDTEAFRVNQYEVGRLLGAGAFGDVKLGTTEDGKEFAVKCLSRSFLKKQREFVKSGAGRPKVKTALDDVQREIAIMKKTNHPNLVNLVEAIDDEKNDSLYIVLEYVTGGQTMYFNGSKKAYFTKDGDVFDEGRARTLARDVVDGLRYLHAQNIIHRDLKPENLLLTDMGVCKIADFGIAQKLDIEKRESASITTMQGTHQFMSPEMITEKKYNGFKVDIWAFGVCLYCFVASKLPFWGDSPEEVFDAITEKALVLPNSLSMKLKNALLRILEKDPANRYSMEDILADPFFEFKTVESISRVELTEEEKMKAITPTIDFVQAAVLKVRMNRWRKNASERSKHFGLSSSTLGTGSEASSNSLPATQDDKEVDDADDAEVPPVVSDSVDISIEDVTKTPVEEEQMASQKPAEAQDGLKEILKDDEKTGKRSDGCCRIC